jgi:hypothetical protein
MAKRTKQDQEIIVLLENILDLMHPEDKEVLHGLLSLLRGHTIYIAEMESELKELRKGKKAKARK